MNTTFPKSRLSFVSTIIKWWQKNTIMSNDTIRCIMDEIRRRSIELLSLLCNHNANNTDTNTIYSGTNNHPKKRKQYQQQQQQQPYNRFIQYYYANKRWIHQYITITIVAIFQLNAMYMLLLLQPTDSTSTIISSNSTTDTNDVLLLSNTKLLVYEPPIATLRPIPSEYTIQNFTFCGGCYFAKIYPNEPLQQIPLTVLSDNDGINTTNDTTTNYNSTTILVANFNVTNRYMVNINEIPAKKRNQCGIILTWYLYNYLNRTNHNKWSFNVSGGIISEQMRKLYTNNTLLYNYYMEQAAYATYQNYPYSCARCNPKKCRRTMISLSDTNPNNNNNDNATNNNSSSVNDDETSSSNSGGNDIFHRYDTVAPKIYNAWTHYLSSIPTKHRFPVEAMDHLDDYFNISENKQKDYFHEYNPSIVQIPLSDGENYYVTNPLTNTLVRAVYLSSYRVSTIMWCYPAKYFGLLNRTRGYLEYTGLAVLDANLTILQEGIFDNGGQQDPRLFVLKNHNNISQIYWTIENEYRALWIMQPDPNEIGPNLRIHERQAVFPNSTLPTIYMSQHGCLTPSNGLFLGKNLIYFNDPTITNVSLPYVTIQNNNNNETRRYNTTITGPVAVVENWPPQDYDGLHRTSFYEPSNPRRCYPRNFQYEANDGEIQSTIMTTVITSNNTTLTTTINYNQNDNTTNSSTTTSTPFMPTYEEILMEPIQPSFYTIEEVWFGQNLISDVQPWHHERGSACCIDMIDPRSGEHVLVGISHANVRAESWPPGIPGRYYDTYFRPGHNSYLSRFYAFQPTMPYKTVALSGHFCWPMSHPTDPGNNPYHGRGDTMFYLEPTNVTEMGSCAKIHFVMSLTYKANTNQESILVAYGVDDCVPRIIEIKTNEVMELLFYGFSRQQPEQQYQSSLTTSTESMPSTSTDIE